MMVNRSALVRRSLSIMALAVILAGSSPPVIAGPPNPSPSDLSSPDLSWSRSYGGADDDYAESVIATPDGGYLIAGRTGDWGFRSYPAEPPHFDVYLLKTDADGESLWARTYGQRAWNEALSIQATADGGYVVAGFTADLDADSLPTQVDAYLLRLDADGDTLWTATYGDTADTFGCAVRQTRDGGFIIAGETGAFERFDIYLIRTDSNGRALWTKRFGDTEWDQAWAIDETLDGGYILFGNTFTSRSGSRDYDAYLVKTDANGDTLWTNACGGSKSDLAWDGKRTSDGGYILTGWTNSFGGRNQDVYVVKTDARGDALWTRTFDGTSYDFGYSVTEARDGSFVVAGHTYSSGTGGWDVYVVKIDVLGNLLWEGKYGGSDLEQGNSILQAADGGYVIAGNFTPADEWMADSDVLLMKTEPDTTGRSPSFNLLAAPNPARAGVVVYYALPLAANVRIAVYNILGREIKILLRENQYPGMHAVPWDGADSDGHAVASGIYFCEFQAGSTITTKKVVITR
ncbi:MAG: T9SS type A sorting domain-containing protein [Candidatus Eisenbacteria bacterium]